MLDNDSDEFHIHSFVQIMRLYFESFIRMNSFMTSDLKTTAAHLFSHCQRIFGHISQLI